MTKEAANYIKISYIWLRLSVLSFSVSFPRCPQALPFYFHPPVLSLHRFSLSLINGLPIPLSLLLLFHLLSVILLILSFLFSFLFSPYLSPSVCLWLCSPFTQRRRAIIGCFVENVEMPLFGSILPKVCSLCRWKKIEPWRWVKIIISIKNFWLETFFFALWSNWLLNINYL